MQISIKIRQKWWFCTGMKVYLHPSPTARRAYLRRIDRVAQLVEHLPFKERVLGSSPSSVTSLKWRWARGLSWAKPKEAPARSQLLHLCAYGGIGRRASLRGWCPIWTWRFESSCAHNFYGLLCLHTLFWTVWHFFYKGQTQNVEQRLERHNKGLVKSTFRYKPWTLVWVAEKSTRKAAMNLEKKLKNLSKERLKVFIDKYK